MAGNEGDGGDQKQPPPRRPARSAHDDEPTQIMARPQGLEPPPRRGAPAPAVRPPQPRPAAGARPLPPPPAGSNRTIVMREAPVRGQPGVAIPSERWPAPTPPPRSVQHAQVPAPRAPAPRPPIQRVAQAGPVPVAQRSPVQQQQRLPQVAPIAQPRPGTAAQPSSQRQPPAPGLRPGAQPQQTAMPPQQPPMTTQPMPQRQLPPRGPAQPQAPRPQPGFAQPQPHHQAPAQQQARESTRPAPPRPASTNPPPFGQTTLIGGAGLTSAPPPAQLQLQQPNVQSYLVPSYDPSRGADPSQPLAALLGSPYPPPAYVPRAAQPQPQPQQPYAQAHPQQPQHRPQATQSSGYPQAMQSSAYPAQRGSMPPQPQPQAQAQAQLPAHFAQPQRAMPSAPAGSIAPPAERSSRRADAMPLGPADDLFLPDATSPPPNVIATCVFLGGPLLVATMIVAMLAFR